MIGPGTLICKEKIEAAIYMIQEKRIGIIGAGTMGEVLTKALISGCSVSPEHITLADIEGHRLEQLHADYGIQTTTDNSRAIEGADILILAVKPQILGTVLNGIAGILETETLVVSIAAGIAIVTIEESLGPAHRVIRVMPNTPAMIGQGATAIAAGRNAREEDLAIVRRIFDAVGLTVTVDEDLMDAVTGLSGSGPAYGFIIIEALADAGVNMGLPRGIALKLASQTMLGAAQFCLNGDKTPSQLKDMVTSPGGTTIEGIKALERGRLRATLMDAVEAATNRSMALGKKKP